ncbi:hypothetical protein EIP91_012139 [Steccherinum ochraceum]|uniref:Uncharacterized protein n=1 Tax=Steccherinum ochraceum TaxID=92696 RepID=A0A4R0RY86_9APHY|nr:hypothetical protein EIP91_012139 [Steccherinum ochraceum]
MLSRSSAAVTGSRNSLRSCQTVSGLQLLTRRSYSDNAPLPAFVGAMNDLKRSRQPKIDIAASLVSQPQAAPTREARALPSRQDFQDIFIPSNKNLKWRKHRNIPQPNENSLSARLAQRKDGQGSNQTPGSKSSQTRKSFDPSIPRLPSASKRHPRRDASGRRPDKKASPHNQKKQYGQKRGEWKNKARDRDGAEAEEKMMEEELRNAPPEDATPNVIQVTTDLDQLFDPVPSARKTKRPTKPKADSQPVASTTPSESAKAAPAPTASKTASPATEKAVTPAATAAPVPAKPVRGASIIATRSKLFLERNAGVYTRYAKVYNGAQIGHPAGTQSPEALGAVGGAALYLSKHPEAGLGQRKAALKVVQTLVGKTPAPTQAVAAL